jgi:hypothetical protein
MKLSRYYWKVDGEIIGTTGCVLVARSEAERLKAQLWRNLGGENNYMVDDYGLPPGSEREGS